MLIFAAIIGVGSMNKTSTGRRLFVRIDPDGSG